MLEVAALFFFHETKVDELEEVTAEVAEIQTQINDITARVKNHEKIKSELGIYRAREDAIAKLQSGRKGPTAVLLELGRILTPNKGPTVDEEKLTKRLGLTDYDEEARWVRTEGIARDASDVSEFAQRLRLSQYFDDVQLKKGGGKKSGSRKGGGAELVNFALAVKVRY
jgi:type IV pilus assembly protein PilN